MSRNWLRTFIVIEALGSSPKTLPVATGWAEETDKVQPLKWESELSFSGKREPSPAKCCWDQQWEQRNKCPFGFGNIEVAVLTSSFSGIWVWKQIGMHGENGKGRECRPLLGKCCCQVRQKQPSSGWRGGGVKEVLFLRKPMRISNRQGETNAEER